MPTATVKLEKSATPPRVLFVASTKSHGGIESHSVDMADALRRRGIPVLFACRPDSVLEEWSRTRGIPTLPFSLRNSGDLSAARRLARLIDTEAIDLVHAHSRRDYVVAVLGAALARRRPRLILHAHMLRPLGEPPRAAGRFFAWGTDAVVAVSGAVCDHLCQTHSFPPALVHFIPNGIALEKFARPGSAEYLRQRQEAREAWGIPEEAVVVGMVGRLDAKGQAAALEAVAALGQSNVWCVFLGSEGEPGAQADLEARAARTSWSERLILTGPSTEIPGLLPGLDLLLHLPADEAFGLALAEAMAAGLPTIATDIGGCREVVRAGRTGVLVPLGNPAALQNALGEMLDPKQGETRRAALGREGRAVAEAALSRDTQIDQIESLYAEVLARPARVRTARVRRVLPRAGWAVGGLALAACGWTALIPIRHAHTVAPPRAMQTHPHLVARTEHIYRGNWRGDLHRIGIPLVLRGRPQ